MINNESNVYDLINSIYSLAVTGFIHNANSDLYEDKELAEFYENLNIYAAFDIDSENQDFVDLENYVIKRRYISNWSRLL